MRYCCQTRKDERTEFETAPRTSVCINNVQNGRDHKLVSQSKNKWQRKMYESTFVRVNEEKQKKT